MSGLSLFTGSLFEKWGRKPNALLKIQSIPDFIKQCIDPEHYQQFIQNFVNYDAHFDFNLNIAKTICDSEEPSSKMIDLLFTELLQNDNVNINMRNAILYSIPLNVIMIAENSQAFNYGHSFFQHVPCLLISKLDLLVEQRGKSKYPFFFYEKETEYLQLPVVPFYSIPKTKKTCGNRGNLKNIFTFKLTYAPSDIRNNIHKKITDTMQTLDKPDPHSVETFPPLELEEMERVKSILHKHISEQERALKIIQEQPSSIPQTKALGEIANLIVQIHLHRIQGDFEENETKRKILQEQIGTLIQILASKRDQYVQECTAMQISQGSSNCSTRTSGSEEIDTEEDVKEWRDRKNCYFLNSSCLSFFVHCFRNRQEAFSSGVLQEQVKHSL